LSKKQFFLEKQNDNRSLTWFLVCRTVVITILLGGASIFYLKGGLHQVGIIPLLALILVTYTQALISVFLLKIVTRPALFAQVQIVWDLLFVTALVVFSGGIESVFSFTYLLVIVAASFLLSRRLTVIVAAGSVILFGGILDLQYYNSLAFLGLKSSDAQAAVYLWTIFIHAVAFILTSVLSGTLADRWRRSEQQLVQKNIDYVQLEKMNSAILFQINSGLMLINPQEEICSFNRAAVEITGYSIAETYGKKYNLIFSDLQIDFSPQAKILNRSECSFIKQDGEQLILGYATTPVSGCQGEYLGVLVTFQDLTQLKINEEELKRSDRLTAIGRMAAGMAHEIRNPLASISGSVQLLLEGKDLTPEDHHLMGIVVKEADRLNGLLTDFLSFARPRPVEKYSVDANSLIQELVFMLNKDQRFQQIEIQIEITTPLILDLDREKMVQALWDLAVNAVEAMGKNGILRFCTTLQSKPQILVEDSGPGIADDIREKIFEPFFSTKEKGSGLGLAAVYSIMEAHQGQLLVADSSLGGACFTLQFSESSITQ
jgi:two-component system sensor histidine kinase PilS (NtrC family)